MLITYLILHRKEILFKLQQSRGSSSLGHHRALPFCCFPEALAFQSLYNSAFLLLLACLSSCICQTFWVPLEATSDNFYLQSVINLEHERVVDRVWKNLAQRRFPER